MANAQIAQKIATSTITITALTTDAEIIAAVTPLGLDAARRSEGMTLLSAAIAAVENTDRLQAVQLAATKTFNESVKASKTIHADLAKVCRAVFVGKSTILTALGLDSRTPTAYGAFVLAAEKLYTVALTGPSEIATTLATYGYPAARLTAEKAQILVLRTEKAVQETAKSVSQEATVNQTAALKALAAYVAQVKKLARVALKNRPQLLERLGIVVK